MNTQELKKKVQVVVIADKNVLLMEFSSLIPNNYSGFQNITGAVEEGEGYTEAAVRELVEEAGIESDVVDLGLQFEFFDRWSRQCHEKVFLCHLDQRPKVILNEEHQHFKWVPIDQITNNDYTFPTNFQAFLAAKEFTKKLAGVRK